MANSTEVSPRPITPSNSLWQTPAGALVLLFVLVAGLLGGAGYWAWHTAKAALPQLAGSLAVDALRAPVEIYRDARGLPHLYAASLEDAVAAQGYLHAQDRLWQMDLQRRAAAGELSEIFGRATIELDRENRILGLRLAADRAAATLPADANSLLEAYARGVNAFIAKHENKVPIEFRFLGYRPKAWLPRDSLLIALNMYKVLTSSWPTELRRAQVSARVGPELAADLFPKLSLYDRPVAEPVAAPRQRRGASTRELQPSAPAGHWFALSFAKAETESLAGSNNWVVSGKHTATGLPLLANDMHLPLNLPTTWYMIHLMAPDLNVAGVSLPGVPFLIVGHNGHIAWGFTNLGADVQDLYEERLDSASANSYLANGGWRPLERRKEVILVKGAKPVEVEVLLSRHGPIVKQEGAKAHALRWTALEPGGLGSSFLRWNQARNWKEFREALSGFPGPAQNVVYADREGNIGYHAAGRIPIRRRGIGAVPVPGETDDYEWVGYIPFDGLPASFNPASGIIATANGRVVQENYPYLITARWESPYRTARIFQLLKQGDRYTAHDFLRLQADIVSLPNQFLAAQLVAATAELRPMEPAIQEAVQALARWDARATTDSPETTICQYTRREAMRLVLEAKLGKHWEQYRWPLSGVFLENILRERPARWLPKQYKVYDALLLDAMRAAFARLRRELRTSDWRKWHWGRIMQIEMVHPLGDRIPLLRRLFNIGPYPQPGTGDCVKQTQRGGGPSQRLVVDFADFDRSLLNLPAGQSGQIGSPYYRDQFEAWLEVRSFPLPFSEAAVNQAAQHHLRLLPARSAGSSAP